MIISALKESGLEFGYYPADVETNSQSCGPIIEKGFSLPSNPVRKRTQPYPISTI